MHGSNFHPALTWGLRGDPPRVSDDEGQPSTLPNLNRGACRRQPIYVFLSLSGNQWKNILGWGWKQKKRQEESKHQFLPAAWPNASHHIVTSDPGSEAASVTSPFCHVCDEPGNRAHTLLVLSVDDTPQWAEDRHGRTA